MDIPLIFSDWLLKFHPQFLIDGQSSHAVTKLGQWAYRDPKFNDPSVLHHLDKGILLTGPYGTGKTEIMKKLQQYINYLQSPYRFGFGSVPRLADEYRENKSIMKKLHKGNYTFDELCLTDDHNVPFKEVINDYGNKNYVGIDLIWYRYDIFKEDGWQTHFITNRTHKELKEIYGSGAHSRLSEMCNIIDITGKNRRYKIEVPTFRKNENNFIPQSTQLPKEDMDKELIEILNNCYIQYLATNSTAHIRGNMFDLFKSFDVVVATEPELHKIRVDVIDQRLKEISMRSLSMAELHRNKALKEQYAANKVDREEELHVWLEVKREAVIRYFQKMKDQQLPKIFDTP